MSNQSKIRVQWAVANNENAQIFVLPVHTIGDSAILLTKESLNDAREISPLMGEILGHPGVKAVAIGAHNDVNAGGKPRDFITITREDGADWAAIKAFAGPLMVQFKNDVAEKRAVLADLDKLAAVQARQNAVAEAYIQGDSPAAERLRYIQSRFNASVRTDGGALQFHEIDENGVIMFNLTGTCKGCPGQEITLYGNLKRMIQHFPELSHIKGMCEIGGTPHMFERAPAMRNAVR